MSYRSQLSDHNCTGGPHPEYAIPPCLLDDRVAAHRQPPTDDGCAQDGSRSQGLDKYRAVRVRVLTRWAAVGPVGGDESAHVHDDTNAAGSRGGHRVSTKGGMTDTLLAMIDAGDPALAHSRDELISALAAILAAGSAVGTATLQGPGPVLLGVVGWYPDLGARPLFAGLTCGSLRDPTHRM
jgi:hypothetical protein